jgi:hypothetical protein
MNTRTKERTSLFCVSELLFSLNLGLAIITLMRLHLATVPPYRSKLSDLASRAIFWLDTVLDLRPRKYSLVGVDLLFLFMLVAVTLILLGVLKIAPGNLKVLALRVLGIPTALLGVPATLLYTHYAMEPGPTQPIDIVMLYGTTFWRWLEVVLVAVCLLLYSLRKWPFPSWVTATLLVAHFTLWGWWIWHLDYFTALWAVPLLLVPPYLACIVYERRRRTQMAV